jgi:hypothetical protein
LLVHKELKYEALYSQPSKGSRVFAAINAIRIFSFLARRRHTNSSSLSTLACKSSGAVLCTLFGAIRIGELRSLMSVLILSLPTAFGTALFAIEELVME